ncbi:MAG: polysaccharide biosynthesis/export family protein [Deltaproteobacteria bacterium]|nr:polysaccharide biosynthesis/export family protein [Deltaproteobacteria bacterium]MBW2323448.1 polysaccharide biosynthesis/export family protein [Deltaproteobacteria bacterium]
MTKRMDKKFFLFDFKKAVILIISCAMTLFAIGCSTPNGRRLSSPEIVEINKTLAVKGDYILGSGDVIALKFLYNRDLNDEVKIGSDGQISLHLLGVVKAAGLTLRQLDEILTKKYYEALGYSLDTYTLGVGDTIIIKLLYNRELDETVMIRLDGKISLHLIGEVTAAGLTPAQLDTLLTKEYAKKLDSQEIPEVSVNVKEFKVPELSVALKESASQVVYVGGEVADPKMINMRGPLKILNAIILAGGAMNNAQMDSVILVRYNGSPTPAAYLLDLNRVMAGELPDVELKPYDIVYLPKTGMAKADQFMQHIYRMLPMSIVISLPYNLNPETRVEVIN